MADTILKFITHSDMAKKVLTFVQMTSVQTAAESLDGFSDEYFTTQHRNNVK